MTCIPVIFDTDAGNDIDDVLAMQMLFNYEKAGKIDLLTDTVALMGEMIFRWDMHTMELILKMVIISAKL